MFDSMALLFAFYAQDPSMFHSRLVNAPYNWQPDLSAYMKDRTAKGNLFAALRTSLHPDNIQSVIALVGSDTVDEVWQWFIVQNFELKNKLDSEEYPTDAMLKFLFGLLFSPTVCLVIHTEGCPFVEQNQTVISYMHFDENGVVNYVSGEPGQDLCLHRRVHLWHLWQLHFEPVLPCSV
jgi:hypothetical protein